MNLYQNYFLLGKCLASGLSDQEVPDVINPIKSGIVDFNTLIHLADKNLILPALYPCFRNQNILDYLPPELNLHLKEIYELNLERNRQIIVQIEAINSILSQKGISPIYMKGAGNLLDNLYEDPGLRILHDIDFLVQENDFESAAEILMENGYSSETQYNPKLKPQIKHYPILSTPDHPAYVEIHRIPVKAKYLGGFEPHLLFKERVKAKLSDSFVLSDSHKLIHNFIHSQLDDKGDVYGKVFLKNLYDVFLFSKRMNIEQVFYDHGRYKRKSSAYLDIYYKSFGIKPEYRMKPKVFLHLYRQRFSINLKYKYINLFSHILIRAFFSYIIIPIKAIYNPHIRNSLRNKLGSKKWYLKHFGWYIEAFSRNSTHP